MRPHAASGSRTPAAERTTEVDPRRSRRACRTCPRVAELAAAGIRCRCSSPRSTGRSSCSRDRRAGIELHAGAWCDAWPAAEGGPPTTNCAHPPRGRKARAPVRARSSCRHWPGSRQRRDDRRPAGNRRAHIGTSWSARRCSPGLRPRSRRCARRWIAAAPRLRMIVGPGLRHHDARRIAKVIERHGERFCRGCSPTSSAPRRSAEEFAPRLMPSVSPPRKPARRRRHRHPSRRVVARHGRHRSALGPADHAVDRRGAKAT